MLANMSKIWAKYSFVYLQGLGGTVMLSVIVVLLGTLIAFLKLSHFRPGQASLTHWILPIPGIRRASMRCRRTAHSLCLCKFRRQCAKFGARLRKDQIRSAGR